MHIPEYTTQDQTSLSNAEKELKDSNIVLTCTNQMHSDLKAAKTVYSLVRKYFHGSDKEYSQSQTRTHYYNLKTKETGAQQCSDFRDRSLADIYLIVRRYKPKATLAQVIDALIRLKRRKRITDLICGTINKRVYYAIDPDDVGDDETGYFDDTDEFSGPSKTKYSKFVENSKKKKLQKVGKRVGSGVTKGYKASSGGPLRQHANSKK